MEKGELETFCIDLHSSASGPHLQYRRVRLIYDDGMANILIIGCVSLDTIHIEKEGYRTTYQTVGGAGLYTALAARMSVDVTLYAPKPNPMPEALAFLDRLLDWQGPSCPPVELPCLEIVHHGGGKATLLNASWGAEALLAPDQLPGLQDTNIVHIAALSSAQAQRSFLEKCRQAKAKAISVGTYAKLVYQQTQEVHQLFKAADYFFMNANEANGLLKEGELESLTGAPKVFITDGEHGATVYDGANKFHVPATKVNELDPTGAGDTFCGATLAHVLHDMPLQEAAEVACDIASRNVEQIGPQFAISALKRRIKSEPAL
jgi:hypothetical protein